MLAFDPEFGYSSGMVLARWLAVGSVVCAGVFALEASRADPTATAGDSTGAATPLGGATSTTYAPPSAVSAALVVPPARVAELRDRAYSETLERELLRGALVNAPAPESVKDYYLRFRDRFEAPEAIDVWRILVASEAQAKSLLAQIKASASPQKAWSLAAREHSMDKATHFRKGHLGFVRADGSTDIPQVRVSPAVFSAARALEDGAVGETPFREGEHWAIVWRRGARKEQLISLDRARNEIVQQLALAAGRAALSDLLAQLRASHVTDYHPELAEGLPASPDAGFAAQRTPRHPHPADATPTPRKTDWGER